MDQSDYNIPELVLKAKSGDQQAMEQLYEMTYSRVYCTIRVMVKDEQETLDLLQDSYIKAFKHLNQFEGTEKFLPWIQQIARNTAKDWLKKKHPAFFADLRSEKKTEWESPAEEQIMDVNDGNWPEKVLDREETARLIREILDGLPEDQRVVIEMFYYERLSVKQIALALGLSESAVKSRLFTAGERSRQRFWHWRRRVPGSMVLLRFPSCSGCCAARRTGMFFPTGICSARS